MPCESNHSLAERTWLAGVATLVALGAVHSIAKLTRIQHDYRLVFVICPWFTVLKGNIPLGRPTHI